LLLLLSLTLASCTPNVCHQREHIPAISGLGSVPIYAIEFDDLGFMWAPKQLDGAVKAIQDLGSSKAVVITFIHGWKHNASSDDGNLLDFEGQLQKRQQNETKAALEAGRPPRPLIGVFIGWRGKSLHLDPWGATANLTFWTRKTAALRVGSNALTEAIFAIAKVTKDQNPQSQVVVIGHSFGGAILERALAQALVALLNQPARPGDGVETFKSPIDLAVLVNPASPAIEARLLMETLMRRKTIVKRANKLDPSDAQFGLPLLVSITAYNDWATGYAFPFGQYPLSIPKSFAYPFEEGPGERSLFSHTAGHTTFLHTHMLKTVPPGTVGPYVFERDDKASYQLVRIDGSWNKSPYWVIRVPSDVVNGHNGIFMQPFQNLMETILDANLVSRPDEATATEIQAKTAP
jgi:hypothetical protein